MDFLGTLVGSAKQMAQNVILEKLDGRSPSTDHPMLRMLHDVFAELSPEKRKDLFTAFESLFEHYKAQPTFDFEALWQEIVKHPIVQDLAVIMSRKLIGG